jgi:two-component system, OmpR family, phosphate regulon response regulator PhoB
MKPKTRSIAMLASNPAFASIFSQALEGSGQYRVAVFATLPALSTFLRISPVDIVVLNVEAHWGEIVEIASGLRHGLRGVNPLVEVITLTISAPSAVSIAGSGIAAALAKPVTPLALMDTIDRVLAGSTEPSAARPRYMPASRPPQIRTPAPVERSGNVIPLFGYRAAL